MMEYAELIHQEHRSLPMMEFTELIHQEHRLRESKAEELQS